MSASRAVARRIRLLSAWLCGGDTDYAAYESDPVEADLHEIGHVVDFFGSLHEALRVRDANDVAFEVDALCEALHTVSANTSDSNEYRALAITFEVAERIGHHLNTQEIAADANLIRKPKTNTTIFRRVASAQRGSRVRRMVNEILLDLERDR